MKRLIFLCSRGVVSGPIAKALFQHMGPSLLLNWEVMPDHLVTIILFIISGVLPRHLDGAEHRQQRLAKSGRTHAGNQYHCYHRHCDHHITLQVHHKTTNISCQKYAVPYTETSPRRVTRKAVANSNIVLASDPDDLQRLKSLSQILFVNVN